MSSFDLEQFRLPDGEKILVVATDLSNVVNALQGRGLDNFRFLSRPDFGSLSSGDLQKENFGAVIYSSSLELELVEAIRKLDIQISEGVDTSADLRKKVVSIRNMLMNTPSPEQQPSRVEGGEEIPKGGQSGKLTVMKLADSSAVNVEPVESQQGEKKTRQRTRKTAITEDAIIAFEAEFNARLEAVLAASEAVLKAMTGISATMRKNKALLLRCKDLAVENQQLKESKRRIHQKAREISKLLGPFKS